MDLLMKRENLSTFHFQKWPSKAKTTGKPETELERFGVPLWTYGELSGINHPDKRLSDYLPYDRIRVRNEFWSSPEDIVPHNDPNFHNATSGEYWRGTPRPGNPKR